MQSALVPASKPALISRIAQYFVDRKKRFVFLGFFVIAMYLAKRRGYLKFLIKYALKQFEERMMKHMEASAHETSRQVAKSAAFTTILKDYYEKFPEQTMVFLRRFYQVEFDLENIKEGLKNKSLSNADKTKNWQAFKSSLLRTLVLTLIAKSYLGTVWLLRDLVSVKAQTRITQILAKYECCSTGENKESKGNKFQTDALAACKEFFESYINALVQKTLREILGVVEQQSMQLEWKLNEKVSIDTFIDKLQQVKTALLQPKDYTEAGEADCIEFPVKNSISKRRLPRLQHKRVLKRGLAIRDIGLMMKRVIFGSQTKIVPVVSDSVAIHGLLGRFRNYRLDSADGVVVSFLLQDTKRRSRDKLSIIAETDEKAEDQSELVDEIFAKTQRVYEESSSWDGKDYDKQHELFLKLDTVLSEVFSEFLDILSSINSRLLTECAIELQFKKIVNRLLLLQKTSVDNQGDILFMKLITSLSKVLDEELLDKQGAKNDLVLYEARTKDLFLVAKRNDPMSADLGEIQTNLLVAEEAKLHALYTRATREFAARVYFEEEFDTFYGEEFDKATDDNKSPAKSEQDELVSMLSRLKSQPQSNDNGQPLGSALQLLGLEN